MDDFPFNMPSNHTKENLWNISNYGERQLSWNLSRQLAEKRKSDNGCHATAERDLIVV